MVMECPSHTWREAPSMRVARVFPSACVVDEKIYVNGGCENLDSTNWMEIFDTKAQTWEFLQIPSEETCIGFKDKSVRYEGTVYVRSEAKDASYKLHKSRWRASDISLNTVWGRTRSSSSHCVVENFCYTYSGKNISWYDNKKRGWKIVKGLEGLTRLPESTKSIKLADHGEKMAILLEEYDFADDKKTIWCVEIAIEKCLNGEILGEIEWCDNVFTTNGRPRVNGFSACSY